MRYVLIFICLIWPTLLVAQDADEDRGFLVGLLESSLGGNGRAVRIDGFSGALSSTATIDKITIADTEGVWLTLEGVAINWTRSALLRGRIEIAELRASRIDLPRLPLPGPGAVPSPEATPFALPDLPASLDIGQLAIDRVALGAPVLGQAAVLSLTGNATLAGGAGQAAFLAQRLDGPAATFDVTAGYTNDTRRLAIDLDLQEAAGGLISNLLDLPGTPGVELAIAGDGPLSDFAATLNLRTDDAPRLAGDLRLQSAEDGPMGFDIQLSGDVTALFLPEYAPFFGPDIRLNAQGAQGSDGAFALTAFALNSRSLRLSGEAALTPSGWPRLLDIEGEIADPSGTPVLLPGTGADTRIDRANLRIAFDASNGDALSGRIEVSGLDHPDLQSDRIAATLDGTLSGSLEQIGQIDTRLDIDATGLGFADAALARAIGPTVRGGLSVGYSSEQPLRLGNMGLTGAAWTLRGDAQIDSLSQAFETTFETQVQTPDLAAFADLAGIALSGAGELSVSGSAALGGFFDITIAGETNDLAIGIAQADAVLGGTTALDLVARRDETGTVLERLTLTNPAVAATASASLQTGASTAQYAVRLDDAGRVTDIVSGPLSINGTARQDGAVWNVAAALAGPLEANADIEARITPTGTGLSLTADIPDLKPLVPQLSGGLSLRATADQAGSVWQFKTALEGPFDSRADVTGRYADAALSAQYDVQLPDVAAVVPGIEGAVRLNGDVQQIAAGWEFDTDLSGPFQSSGRVSGRYVANAVAAQYTLRIPDVAPLAPGVSGEATLAGDIQQIAEGWQFASDLTGPYATSGRVSGQYVAARLAANFAAGLPDVAPLAPGLSGPVRVNGDLRQTDAGWAVETDLTGPYLSSGTADAALDADGLAANYALQIPNVAPLVPGISGAASVTGTARQVARGFDITAALQGPAGTTARVDGLIANSGRLELDATGQAQLGLINRFIEPRSIAGTANFDLTVDGPAALSSVTGQITTQGTRLAAPNLPLSFDDISGSVQLARGQATLALNAGVSEGGTIGVSGPITISGSYPAQIDVSLTDVVIADPALYSSILNGGVGINGPLSGGARIAGAINVGETNVQVPTSGITTFGALPDITHIGATRPVMRTRQRAGLDAATTSDNNAGGPAFPLDITVNAPSRIFIRGRGLDAELGGTLRLTGTSADTISTGQFDLIRGRLLVLNKRFDLDEGRVQLQGRFAPFLRFVANTSTSTGTASIIVEGPATEPTVSFSANPDAPQDQVLAQIFFGRDISQLSAFQALQLANAVATLAGRGGEGLVSKLRGGFALDDLDVSSDDEGNTAVRAGKYLSDNVYTDVTVGGAAGPEVSVNIDLTPNITVKGSVGSDSNTGLGIFIEKDY